MTDHRNWALPASRGTWHSGLQQQLGTAAVREQEPDVHRIGGKKAQCLLANASSGATAQCTPADNHEYQAKAAFLLGNGAPVMTQFMHDWQSLCS